MVRDEWFIVKHRAFGGAMNPSSKNSQRRAGLKSRAMHTDSETRESLTRNSCSIVGLLLRSNWKSVPTSLSLGTRYQFNKTCLSLFRPLLHIYIGNFIRARSHDAIRIKYQNRWPSISWVSTLVNNSRFSRRRASAFCQDRCTTWVVARQERL